MVTAMRTQRERAVDFETTGLRWANGSRPIGYGLGFMEGDHVRAWYVPFAHATAEAQADLGQAAAAFHDALDGADQIIGQNLKFEINMGRASGFALPEAAGILDTMIEAYLVDENRPGFALEKLAAQTGVTYYGDPFDMKNEVDAYLAGRARDRRMPMRDDTPDRPAYLPSFGHSEVPVGLEGEYCCRDIGHALLVDRALRNEALGVGTAYADRRRSLFRNEMLLVRAIAEMERQGQRVDVDYLRAFGADLDTDLAARRVALSRSFGATIDWGNDNAIREFLYERLRLPVVKRTKTKQASVDRGTLLALQAQQRATGGRWADALAEYAEFAIRLTVRNGFSTTLADRVDRDGRVRSSFKQHGTGTGRLSSENPNLQNIPVRHSEMAKRIRRGFLVDSGRARVLLDYSQVELRILAWTTGAAAFLEAYRSPAWEGLRRNEYDYAEYRRRRRDEPAVDVHATQAKRAFGVDESHPQWKNKRRAAKVINFGVPYGMGPTGMAENPELMIPVDEAKAYLTTYNQQNPEIGACKAALYRKMRAQPVPHFVNWTGRCRHVPALNHPGDEMRGAAEREAFASLIQGAAAELTRISLVRLYLARSEGRIAADATQTVHDEIQLDCDLADVQRVGDDSQEIMEDFRQFGGVPIVASREVTTSTWADKEDLP